MNSNPDETDRVTEVKDEARPRATVTLTKEIVQLEASDDEEGWEDGVDDDEAGGFLSRYPDDTEVSELSEMRRILNIDFEPPGSQHQSKSAQVLRASESAPLCC